MVDLILSGYVGGDSTAPLVDSDDCSKRRRNEAVRRLHVDLLHGSTSLGTITGAENKHHVRNNIPKVGRDEGRLRSELVSEIDKIEEDREERRERTRR